MTLIAFLIIFPLVIAALLLLVKGDWPRNIIVGISAAVIAVASILLAVQYLGTAHRLFEFSSVIVDYVGTAISIAIAAVIISFGVKYKNNHHQLHDGDILFLYTDGLPEASNSKGKMLDFDRMLEALNQHKSESPQGIVDGVRHYVSKFVGKAPQFDDLTILCVSYDKKGRS